MSENKKKPRKIQQNSGKAKGVVEQTKGALKGLAMPPGNEGELVEQWMAEEAMERSERT